ncbi:MAG: PHB depolymerase family esterase [Mycobacteriaceae bacterium]|jgi:polyhydroxybutyrate depolymerase
MAVIARWTAFIATISFLGYVAGGPASASPGDPPGALTIGGLQRTYLVHAPAGGAPVGLVLNLHGAGQTGGQQAALTGYDAVADQYGFVVAYPDGIDLSWADGRGASVPDRQGIDDVGFLAALIDRLSVEYGIPAGRVFVTGMSAGAFMANRLACDRADLISAIAPVSGTLGMGVPCAPSRAVSVLQIHGTADQVVPYSGGGMIGRGGASEIVSAPALTGLWAAVDRCASPPTPSPAEVPRLVAAGCAGGAEVVLVSINGGGHIWPADQAINASQASAQFFAAH